MDSYQYQYIKWYPVIHVRNCNGVVILQPGDFVHTLGDAHVYVNHIEALQEQVYNNSFTALQMRDPIW